MAVADCVEDGTIPADEADNLFICVGVFIHWHAEDDKKIQDYNYQAVKESIQRAVAGYADAEGGGGEAELGQAPVLAEIAGAPPVRRCSAGRGAARKRRAIQRAVVDRGRHEHGVHAKGLEALEVPGIAHAAGGDEAPCPVPGRASAARRRATVRRRTRRDRASSRSPARATAGACRRGRRVRAAGRRGCRGRGCASGAAARIAVNAAREATLSDPITGVRRARDQGTRSPGSANPASSHRPSAGNSAWMPSRTSRWCPRRRIASRSAT